ncbi:MAG: hypothetical protein IKS94_06200 [Prevotella sp.]|nr:hypothetical protein [Prevotella sp.]
MKKVKTDFSGIWTLVEEYELREKAKIMGYVLRKDYSKTEKLIKVIRDFANVTNNLRCFLLSTFIVVSDWSVAFRIIATFELLRSVYTKFNMRK